MFNLNKVLLIGNLTRDPEVRELPSGGSVADLGLAVSRRFKTQGEQRDETCFVRVTLFGKSAETAGKWLKKGRAIFVDGRLKYDEWEKDGKKNSRLSVVADRFEFVSDGDRGEGRRAEYGDTSADAGPSPAPRVPPPPPPPGPDHATEGDREDLPF